MTVKGIDPGDHDLSVFSNNIFNAQPKNLYTPAEIDQLLLWLLYILSSLHGVVYLRSHLQRFEFRFVQIHGSSKSYWKQV